MAKSVGALHVRKRRTRIVKPYSYNYQTGPYPALSLQFSNPNTTGREREREFHPRSFQTNSAWMGVFSVCFVHTKRLQGSYAIRAGCTSIRSGVHTCTVVWRYYPQASASSVLSFHLPWIVPEKLWWDIRSWRRHKHVSPMMMRIRRRTRRQASLSGPQIQLDFPWSRKHVPLSYHHACQSSFMLSSTWDNNNISTTLAERDKWDNYEWKAFTIQYDEPLIICRDAVETSDFTTRHPILLALQPRPTKTNQAYVRTYEQYAIGCLWGSAESLLDNHPKSWLTHIFVLAVSSLLGTWRMPKCLRISRYRSWSMMGSTNRD